MDGIERLNEALNDDLLFTPLDLEREYPVRLPCCRTKVISNITLQQYFASCHSDQNPACPFCRRALKRCDLPKDEETYALILEVRRMRKPSDVLWKIKELRKNLVEQLKTKLGYQQISTYGQTAGFIVSTIGAVISFFGQGSYESQVTARFASVLGNVTTTSFQLVDIAYELLEEPSFIKTLQLHNFLQCHYIRFDLQAVDHRYVSVHSGGRIAEPNYRASSWDKAKHTVGYIAKVGMPLLHVKRELDYLCACSNLETCTIENVTCGFSYAIQIGTMILKWRQYNADQSMIKQDIEHLEASFEFLEGCI